MRHPPNHIFEHTPESLTAWCADRGMPAFRATQILEWVYRRGVVDPAAMSNLSKRDRETLAAEMTFLSGDILAHQIATDGTQKLLIQWCDYAEGAPAADQRTRSASKRPDAEVAGDADATDTSINSAPIAPESLDIRTRLTVLSPALPTPDSTRQTECVMIPSENAGSDEQEERGARRSPGPRLIGGRGEEARLPARSTDRAAADRSSDRPADRLPDRRTACISSQVGCPVGCRFCASGVGGLDANLSAGRIVEQVWRLRHALRGGSGVHGGPALQAGSGSTSRADDRDAPDSARRAEHGLQGRATSEHGLQGHATADDLPRITNVVFMGMGEPLSNFRPVTTAIRAIAAPWGHGISARKITISTVGMPRAIERLAEEFDLPVTLALSLHAPTDAIRRALIPWAEYSTINQLLAACQKWFEKTGREITLEYTLLGGVNDAPEHAAELARLAKNLRANVNLIRYNEVAGMPFSRPATAGVRAFQEVLRSKGINAHIRASRGRDIAAACGQLRHEAKAG